MIEDKLLVDSEYLLQKFPGKGGWTYAEIPEIAQNKNNPFGWVKVWGSIDGYELKHYKLMPMGNGRLFLPVRTEIRKKIKKEAGDFVRVVLYLDETTYAIPEEIKECFTHESTTTWDNFNKLTEGEQKTYIDWIYDARTDDTKTNRIVAMMDRLKQGLRLTDK